MVVINLIVQNQFPHRLFLDANVAPRMVTTAVAVTSTTILPATLFNEAYIPTRRYYPGCCFAARCYREIETVDASVG